MPIYTAEAAFAISSALTMLPESQYAIYEAVGLISLLQAAAKDVDRVIGVDIMLSWKSEVLVPNPYPGDCYVFEVQVSQGSPRRRRPMLTHVRLQPTFFSTKDMCLRFLSEDNEGIIPQVFLHSMANVFDGRD